MDSCIADEIGEVRDMECGMATIERNMEILQGWDSQSRYQLLQKCCRALKAEIS